MMSNEQTIGVVLRTLGVLLVFNAVTVLIWQLPWAFQADGHKWLPAIIHSGVWLAIGTLLAAKPISVARTLLSNPRAEENTTIGHWSLDEFQSILFSVLGVYILAFTLPSLSGLEQLISLFSGILTERALPSWDAVRMNLEYILRLATGFWLMLGAKSLRRFIWRVRRLGENA